MKLSLNSKDAGDFHCDDIVSARRRGLRRQKTRQMRRRGTENKKRLRKIDWKFPVERRTAASALEKAKKRKSEKAKGL